MTTKLAAGILYLTPDNQVLLLQRGPGGDYPGAWATPGGHQEDGETPEECARRETLEEAGSAAPVDGLTLLTRSVAPSPGPGGALNTGSDVLSASEPVALEPQLVDFTTFLRRIDEQFPVVLSDEHTGYAWVSIDALPQDIHPGVRIALNRLRADELGIARMIVAGELTSPQQYENVALFAIRITGTGVAYRTAHDEYVWRDPAHYLNDEFLARANGLAVIWEHPKKAVLDSKEFGQRAVGSVMLPFIPSPAFLAVHPEARADEVWGIAKIYDDEAKEMMTSGQMSTSPSVVFRDPAVNSKMTLEDGSALLIEGKPSLLDHIAICAAGVWDKGGAPTGVINDSQGEPSMTEEEKARADALARADQQEAQARADAEVGAKLDQILGALGNASKRMDAIEARLSRADSEDADKKADADEDEDKKADEDDTGAKEVVADKRKDSDEDDKKADADEDEDKKADADEDESAKADSQVLSAIQRKLAELDRKMPKQLSDADFAAMADAQARADRVYQAFGDSAPRPMSGEDVERYRRRLAHGLKGHSANAKDINVYAIADDAAFKLVENTIYNDAMAAAMSPVDLKPGTLRALKARDVTGREITTFAGQPRDWMRNFAGNSMRLTAINQNRTLQ